MEQQKKDTNDQELMRSMKVSKAVAAMAIPSVISSLVTVVYNMADTFFVGQTGDALQVAAVSLTNPIFILLIYSILKAQSNYFFYQLVVYNREQKRHF